MFYRLFRILAAMTLRLFFRNIEVYGPAPRATGPLLLVSNHTNSLVDPLFPLITLKRRITLTAKSVLKGDPLLAVLSWGLGSIAFHRKEDVAKGADPRQNVESMRRCRETLAQGGALCIFPEGISHSDLSMRPFHPGAARIAIGFIRKDHNPGELQIVPVGLLYTNKAKFRSDVCLCFGDPIDAGEWLAKHPEAKVDDLTVELRDRIEQLVISYENRREMLIVNAARDVVMTQARLPRALGSNEPSAAESFLTLRRLQHGYRSLIASHESEVVALADRVRDYRRELKHRGIEPSEVYLPLNPFRALLFLLRELELVFIGAPLAIWGAINHLAPYLIVRCVARRLSRDRDHWATNVIYPSFVIFPLFYLMQCAAAWICFPRLWAAVYCVALPYTGIYVILYSDRTGSAWRRARTFLYFLFHPSTQSRLASEGRAILADVNALATQLPAT